jgi:two-component system OmpR family response regulator
MDPTKQAKKRILVVDDEPTVCSFLATALADAGYDVVTAPDGRLKGVDLSTIDLVLVDIFMPERDGFEVIQDLRKNRPGLALVAMTGDPNYHGMEALDIVRRLGADAALSKPFAMKAVLTICEDLLSRKGRAPAK